MVDVSMMNKKEYSVVHQKRQEDPITKPYTSSVGNIDASENSRTTVQSTPNGKIRLFMIFIFYKKIKISRFPSQ